ncbi:unnamed protein product [Anisakis simplex]|uniref:SSD domain-containing protein n=1 Tax=Anisakis simplex TaxID=6269 RepID=A0A0M3JRV8_ANISI|nr:unnamed protein product [Anisakis simplex]
MTISSKDPTKTSASCRWAPLEKPLANLLGRYCRFVARYPWPFIIAPTLLTCFLSTGIFLNFEIVRGVRYLYAPLNAKWKFEEEVLHRNWAATDQQFYPGKDIMRRKGLYLMVQAKDYGSVLRRSYANEFVRLLDWISTEHFKTDDGIEYSYRNICLRFQNDCFTNAHARLLGEIFSKGDQDALNVTYPKFYSQYSTEPIDLSLTLGGIETNSRQRLLYASTWMILYQLKQHSDLMMKLSSHFEIAVSERINSGHIPTSLFNVYYFHSDTFELELAESNRRLIPSFLLTFIILSIFSVMCTFNVNILPMRNGSFVTVVDWVTSKPLMGIVGVITTLMAIVSATGLLLLFKVTFVDMATVMPFLSLTIGIDDTFLMLAAWHETKTAIRHCYPPCEGSSSVSSVVEDRIERAMRHAAVSISITSLTDAIAFIIGSIAPLPAVIYFCYYSSAAICFIFAYSLTIFVAFLAIQGRWEESYRHCVLHLPTEPFEHIETVSFMQRYLNMGSRTSVREIHIHTDLNGSPLSTSSRSEKIALENRLWYQRFFEDFYAPFIANTLIQTIALISFIVYLAIACWGTKNVKVGFDLMSIIQKDSPPRRFLEIRNELFVNVATKVDVAVMHPPNMGDHNARIRFFEALNELEQTNCSVGQNGTDFWYFAYQRFVSRLGFGDSWATLNQNETEFNLNLKSFLMTNERYAHDILLYENGSMRAFRLSVQLINKQPSDEHIILCAKLFREAAAKYESEFNITTYTQLWALADQFEIMWPQTMQDLYISIAVMIPVSLLFIPQPLCALVIALNIASIAVGVIGFMTLWSVHLDATSMITIAMSVGFSVDFAAHITYGYMTETKKNEISDAHSTAAPYQQLVKALGAVGWPVTQASVSVLLGIMTLATLDSYVVKTCFKTILIVIIIGKMLIQS